MKHTDSLILLSCFITGLFANILFANAQVPVVPSVKELSSPFENADANKFKSPPKVFYPETWFHYIGGNVSIKGITADLEAIADAGFSGIHCFTDSSAGPLAGVAPQIAALVRYGVNGETYGRRMPAFRVTVHHAELPGMGNGGRSLDKTV